MWSVIVTWNFSLEAVKKASLDLSNGGSSLDAVETIAKDAEDNPYVQSIGYGGLPNIAGEIELDAAVMSGTDLSIGAVAGLQGFRHPISIARAVLPLPNNVLIGDGAAEFALNKRFKREILMTQKSCDDWYKVFKEKNTQKTDTHDTIGIVSLDTKSRMHCGTSTSGLFMKPRGRVGDSPLVGSGFYVDDTVGGAAATGVGEDIMKGCLCYKVTLLMSRGLPPDKAAEEAVGNLHMRLKKHMVNVGDISVVCMDNKGNFGAATNKDVFEYCVSSSNDKPEIRSVKKVAGI